MADLNLKPGQTIQTHDGRQGVVRYIGTLHIAAGDWLGLELADSSGKNDGSVKGERYFECKSGHGIFVRKESAVKIVKQATASTRPSGATSTTNGAAIKPRPSSGITPDIARRRQSLMGGGSATTAGSRLSVRVSQRAVKCPFANPSLVPDKVTAQSTLFCEFCDLDSSNRNPCNSPNLRFKRKVEVEHHWKTVHGTTISSLEAYVSRS